MSSVETGQMSAVETGQMSAAETGQMSAVPESSGSASACGVRRKHPQGFARGEQSEEGGERALCLQTPSRIDFGEVLGPFWDHVQRFFEPSSRDVCMRS